MLKKNRLLTSSSILFAIGFLANNSAYADDYNLVDSFASKTQKITNEPEYQEFYTQNLSNIKNGSAYNLVENLISFLGYSNSPIILMIDGEIISENGQIDNRLNSSHASQIKKIELFQGEDSAATKISSRIINLVSNDNIGAEKFLSQYMARSHSAGIRTGFLTQKLPQNYEIPKNFENLNTSLTIENSNPVFETNINGELAQNGEVIYSNKNEEKYQEANFGVNGQYDFKIGESDISLKINNSNKDITKTWGNFQSENHADLTLKRGIYSRTKQLTNIDFTSNSEFLNIPISLSFSSQNSVANESSKQINIKNTSAKKYFENSEIAQSFHKLRALFTTKKSKFYTEAKLVEINNNSENANVIPNALPLYEAKKSYDLRELSLASGVNTSFSPSPKITVNAGFSGVYYDFAQKGAFNKSENELFANPNLGFSYKIDNSTKIKAETTQKRGKFYYGDYGFNTQIANSENQENWLKPETTLATKLSLEKHFDENANLVVNIEQLSIKDKIGAVPIYENGKIIGQATGNMKKSNLSIIEANFNWKLDDIAQGLHLKSKFRVNKTDTPNFISQNIGKNIDDRKDFFELNIAQKIDDNNGWGAFIQHQSKHVSLNYDAIAIYPNQEVWGVYFDILEHNGAKWRAEFNNPFSQDYLIYKTQYSGNLNGQTLETLNFAKQNAAPKIALSFKKSL